MTSGLSVTEIGLSVAEAGRSKPVLRNLNLTFEAGKFTCVGGPSGAGKTTLLSILALIVAPDAGEVWFEGVDLLSLSEGERGGFRSANIAMVFQTLRLIEVMTVREHLSLAAMLRSDPGVKVRGEELIEDFGLSTKLDRLPRELSAGEKQRVALAQALAVRPRIVLADEPTAALDSRNALFVAEQLAKYAQRADATVVCVSHDPIVFTAAHSSCELPKM